MGGGAIFPEIPICRIREELFKNDFYKDSIIKDYGIKGPPPADEFELSKALIKALRQKTNAHPPKEVKADKVFKAAVYAIGSGAADWVRFINVVEPKLEFLLDRYDPETVSKKNKEVLKRELILALGSREAKEKSKAILKWADILTAQPDFYQNTIVKTYEEVDCQLRIEGPIKYPIYLLCLAKIFADPLKKWKKFGKENNCGEMKFIGMGVPIACEFLRNLKWDGYKPDTHITWAIERWKEHLKHLEDKVTCTTWDMLDVIRGASHNGTSKLPKHMASIQTALYATYATPYKKCCDSYSEADNLLWAYVSYLKKKNKFAKNPKFIDEFKELINNSKFTPYN